MDIASNIFGTLFLLLMAIGCRSCVVIEARPKRYPKWLCWFGNILSIALLSYSIVIWFI